ncbi:hypothetical protein RSOLAG1IB_07551 [Rhizoctonia solani AG-1 IB]|uniref:Peptidase C14 caspase domain-containing protein n=1 Tax=Thanatephorus cucumeris (strain AG1-IB / isolate 7/3/14) TaxID=1108050 RepID=A0A0B7FIQ3_THACB|nr:hypothetical protein RSOLAG1IB_07551 [Rhizoctonia solani AG-1 IB]
MQDAMEQGDMLPNTPSSLGARVARRALVVVARHEWDARNIYGGSLCLPSAPTDALRVYRMLLSRGYEKKNIRILVEGLDLPETSPTKQNILDSLEWLVGGAQPGDYRFFHFSGHGQAYKVEEGQGRKARVVLAPPGASENTESPATENQSPPPIVDRTEFYREGLLTEWKRPFWKEKLKESFSADDYSRINDYELSSVLAKLPKGCTLTTTLDCFHGAQMHDINAERENYPKLVKRLIQALTDAQDVPSDFGMSAYSKPSLYNWFVPPAFYLHSDYVYEPKVKMERLDEYKPFKDVQATVISWSGYYASKDHIGTFTSAFTNAVQEMDGDVSNSKLYEQVRQRIPAEDGLHVQLWTSNNGEEEADRMLNDGFVI